MNWTDLDRIIRGMSAHDIIMAMVNGLREPTTAIEMDTLIEWDYDEEDFWVAGAFVNTVVYICGYTRCKEDQPFVHDICASIDNARYFFNHTAPNANRILSFEAAIYSLSRGIVEGYNKWASPYFALIIPIPGQVLPRLRADYTEDELEEYVKLAKHNKNKNQQK